MNIKFKDNPFKKTVNRRKRLSFIARLFKKRNDAACELWDSAQEWRDMGNDIAYEIELVKGSEIIESSPFKFLKS